MPIEIGTGDNQSFGPGTHRGAPIAVDGFAGYYDQACASIYLIGKRVYVAITSTGHLDGNCHAPTGTAHPSLATLTNVLKGLSLAAHSTHCVCACPMSPGSAPTTRGCGRSSRFRRADHGCAGSSHQHAALAADGHQRHRFAPARRRQR
ncbi:MAG: hypothetical protein DLM56_04880 [Pseudonocardiales bacterium]|nr:MAG: hypothetical protein DLM56_04880 [Pseudonocardiales bacterium]